MSTIHFHRKTTALTAEQYVAGVTDFGPGRSKLFGNTTDGYLKVHRPGRPKRPTSPRAKGRHLGTPALRLVLLEPHRA